VLRGRNGGTIILKAKTHSDGYVLESDIVLRRRHLAAAARTRVASVLIAATLFLLCHVSAKAADTPAGGLSASELQSVSDGEVVVRVDPADGNADGIVTAAVDIEAPTTAVWEVLVNCDRAAAIMANLTSCRILDRAADGLADRREHRIRWLSLLPDIRSEFRSVYDPGRSIRFSRSGGDMSALDGEWRIEQRRNGLATRLHYRARVGFAALVPGFVIRQALARDVPGFLGAIRTESLRR
jgi:carbon monoxide dehydrogenase subunit G